SGPGRTREDRELFLRHQRERDTAARAALVERFLPLARQLARRYQRAEEPLEDLVQVASLGLIKAIDRFNPDRDVAFSSYAVPTILGELKRHFRDRTWAVRVPRDLQELALKVDRAVSELSRESHRAPSVTQIAQRVGASEDLVRARFAKSGYRSAHGHRPGAARARPGGAGAAQPPAARAPQRAARRAARRAGAVRVPAGRSVPAALPRGHRLPEVRLPLHAAGQRDDDGAADRPDGLSPPALPARGPATDHRARHADADTGPGQPGAGDDRGRLP